MNSYFKFRCFYQTFPLSNYDVSFFFPGPKPDFPETDPVFQDPDVRTSGPLDIGSGVISSGSRHQVATVTVNRGPLVMLIANMTIEEKLSARMTIHGHAKRSKVSLPYLTLDYFALLDFTLFCVI